MMQEDTTVQEESRDPGMSSHGFTWFRTEIRNVRGVHEGHSAFRREVCCSLLAAYPEQVASPTIIDLVLQGPIAISLFLHIYF